MSYGEQFAVQPIGAILVGGKSARMGQPKHAMRLADGRMMIEHVAEALQPVCREIVLLGEVGDDVLPGAKRIADLHPGRGPLSGIEALLAGGLGDSYLVCPCDVPRMTAELLGKLVVGPPALARVFHVTGRGDPEMLPMWIAAAAAGHVHSTLQSKEPSVWALLKSLGNDVAIVEIDESCGEQLRNVNTPRELAEVDEA